MKWFKKILITCIISACFIPFIHAQSSKITNFEIHRGINVSHWLSQSKARGAKRDSLITEKDFKYIASLGFDHIRLPMDEEQMWDEQGNKYADAFLLMHNGVKWSLKYKLKVVIDLHIIRSHSFNETVNHLWTDVAEQDKFVKLWMDLSGELKKYSTDLVAYELMNEAVTDDPDNWNNLFARTLSEIRKSEPKRKIVQGSNLWQSVTTFKSLKIPANDPNIILSFHFYDPHLFTHYKAGWSFNGPYNGPVKYPGQIIEDKDLVGQQLKPEALEELHRRNGIVTKDTLAKLMDLAIKVARQHNLQLYCGEWGCLKTMDNSMRLQWIADVRAIMEKNNIAWTLWDYRGGFGIVDNKDVPEVALIKVLLE
jgi:endoglucanase